MFDPNAVDTIILDNDIQPLNTNNKFAIVLEMIYIGEGSSEYRIIESVDKILIGKIVSVDVKMEDPKTYIKIEETTYEN